MASSSSVHAPERIKVEQIVLEFFAKSLHIILESRIPDLGADSHYLGASASSSISGSNTRDRWFNLALGDCTTALENFEPWRRSFSDPMVVDILLDHPKLSERKPAKPRVLSSESCHGAQGSPQTRGLLSTSDRATVLERWTVQFEQRKRSSAIASASKPASGRDASRFGAGETHIAQVGIREEWARSQKARNEEGVSLPAHVSEVSAVYKRTVVMLRSLYSVCRLLPAYRMFRMSSMPTNWCDFSLNYLVLSSATPLTEFESRDMSMYNFTPVATTFGRMCLSVQYRIQPAVVALEIVPSIPPRIIPDYVGSPITDPLKRFTGGPHSLPGRGKSIGYGEILTPVPSSLQNSPPFAGLDRRHSWTGRIDQVELALQPPSSPSYDLNRQLGTSTKASQPISMENRCSPPCSSSPSTSPPTLYRRSQPVIIPKSSQSKGCKFSVGDPYHRSKNLLPPLLPNAKKAGLLPRSSSECPRFSGHLALNAHESSRSLESPSQLSTLHGDHAGQVWMNKASGPCMAENLLFGQMTLSRSSSQTALGDDGEDDDFPCPFAVDDVEVDKKGGRGEPSESSSGLGSLHLRSLDATIGALIGALKSAPSLRHSSDALGEMAEPSLSFGAKGRDLQYTTPRLCSPEGRVSLQVNPPNSYTGKMAAEALKELQFYKHMRDLMSMQEETKQHLKWN